MCRRRMTMSESHHERENNIYNDTGLDPWYWVFGRLTGGGDSM